MTTKDEALAKALEALEPVSTYGRVGSRDTDTAKAQQAITAIREALAQPSEWVGLSDEEANELWESTDSDWELMKRTESKLREKNARKDIPAADKAGGDEPVVLAGLTKDEIWTQCCAEWRGKCDTDTACYTRHQPQGGE